MSLDPPSEVLGARAVTKRFGSVVALDRVSLSVRRGDCLALVGESGSGKTTLLRCFNALLRPDAGQVLVDGRDVGTTDPIALRRRIGYVPQEGGLLPHWRVQRNVELVPRLRDQPDRAARGHEETFAALRAELGVTAVLVTHDLREALRLGTRVAVMRAGRVEQEAGAAALLASPATPYVASLLQRAGVAPAP